MKYDWESELELCLIAQGYVDILWIIWLRIFPSPFSWFKHLKELEEIIDETTKEDGGNKYEQTTL